MDKCFGAGQVYLATLWPRVFSGRYDCPGATLFGKEVANGLVKLESNVSVLQVSFKFEKEFAVSKPVILNMHVSKLGTPQ